MPFEAVDGTSVVLFPTGTISAPVAFTVAICPLSLISDWPITVEPVNLARRSVVGEPDVVTVPLPPPDDAMVIVFVVVFSVSVIFDPADNVTVFDPLVLDWIRLVLDIPAPTERLPSFVTLASVAAIEILPPTPFPFVTVIPLPD